MPPDPNLPPGVVSPPDYGVPLYLLRHWTPGAPVPPEAPRPKAPAPPERAPARFVPVAAGLSGAPAVRSVQHQEGLGPVAPARDVVLNLDAVLRLTAENNAQIALAREKVNEALAAAEVACRSCVPNLLRKDAYKPYQAKAKVWQQRVELARVTNENQLDAGNTYIDWLAARRGEAIARQVQKYDQDLLQRAEALRKDDPNATVLVETLRGTIEAEDEAIARLEQQAGAAVDKLLYLLGLHDVRLVPADATLEPMELVDASLPTELLVDQAVNNGPGVRELLGLRSVVQCALDQATGLLERLDHLGCPAACARLREAQSKLQQVDLALEDLRRKLAAGVREAQSAILVGRGRLRLDRDRIRHAAEAYRLSNLRLKENAPGNSVSETLQTVRGLEAAHSAYLGDVRDYNKAELRLLLLLGNGGPACKPAPLPAPVPDVTGAAPRQPPTVDTPRQPATEAAPRQLPALP